MNKDRQVPHNPEYATKPRYVRMTDEMFEAVENLAQKRGWTFAGYIRYLAQRELVRIEKQEDKQPSPR